MVPDDNDFFKRIRDPNERPDCLIPLCRILYTPCRLNINRFPVQIYFQLLSDFTPTRSVRPRFDKANVNTYTMISAGIVRKERHVNSNRAHQEINPRVGF